MDEEMDKCRRGIKIQKITKRKIFKIVHTLRGVWKWEQGAHRIYEVMCGRDC